MPRIVVTAGKDFLDVDAYGGVVGYAELLKLQGETVVATSTAPLNVSVTPSLRSLQTLFTRLYTKQNDDQFAVVDLSDPLFFDTFVEESRVVTVVDHHAGHEQYWQNQIGDKARIKFVGAACTLVYELWEQTGLLDKMTPEAATLLAAGIIDNTLNFKARLTTERDKQAYEWLRLHAGLPETWADEYLQECQVQLEANLVESVTNDTKIIQYPGLSHKIAIAQLAVLNPKTLLQEQELLATQMVTSAVDWYVNVIDLSQGVSVFYTSVPNVQDWLAETLGLVFTNNIATADRPWLRKEIYKKVLHEKNNSN